MSQQTASYKELNLNFENIQVNKSIDCFKLLCFLNDLIQKVQKKELEETSKSNENKKVEIDLHLEKLMDQLKENRKEVFEEQSKNRELRERFKMYKN